MLTGRAAVVAILRIKEVEATATATLDISPMDLPLAENATIRAPLAVPIRHVHNAIQLEMDLLREFVNAKTVTMIMESRRPAPRA